MIFVQRSPTADAKGLVFELLDEVAGHVAQVTRVAFLFGRKLTSTVTDVMEKIKSLRRTGVKTTSTNHPINCSLYRFHLKKKKKSQKGNIIQMLRYV